VVFLANKMEDGSPIAGNFGGIDRADEICQYWGDKTELDRNFKAVLSVGVPSFEGAEASDPVHARDRFSLTDGPIMLVTNRSVETVVERASDFWSCDGAKIKREINFNSQRQEITEGMIWMGTDCEGRATYFHCNAWTQEALDEAVDPDAIDDAFNYLLHQQVGNAASFFQVFSSDYGNVVGCESTGSLLCLSD
jgi:hypothetical protein